MPPEVEFKVTIDTAIGWELSGVDPEEFEYDLETKGTLITIFSPGPQRTSGRPCGWNMPCLVRACSSMWFSFCYSGWPRLW